jgi:peptidoglycan/LPS O-acetylase OafA/YrhL
MTSRQDPPAPPTFVVFWIIWFAILQGLVLIQFFVGGGIPKGADQGDPPAVILMIAGGLALAALAVRFTVIPKIKTLSKLLVAMVIGLALSEAVGFVGIFLVGKEFPTTRLSLFVLALCCIVSHAPVYAKKLS